MMPGGWSFVAAAYAVVWVTLGLYTTALWRRAAAREGKGGPPCD